MASPKSKCICQSMKGQDSELTESCLRWTMKDKSTKGRDVSLRASYSNVARLSGPVEKQVFFKS